MFNDDYYKLKVSVSTDAYWNKEDVNACVGSSKKEENKDVREKYGHRRNHKMSFKTIEVTAPELLNYCLKGYSFCNLFIGFPEKGWNDKGSTVTYIKKDGSFTLSAKKNEYFYGSNAICIDIDSTAAPTIKDYVDRLSHKPTFWYTTFSHMEPGKGIRFRMVYALAEPIIGQQQFDAVVDQVHRRIESEVGEMIEDKCGEKCSQYFNGTNVKNDELVVEYKYYGYIYSINDIYNNVIEREDNNKTTTNYPSWQNDNTLEIPSPNDWLLYDMDHLSYDAFMQAHRHQYNYCYRSDSGEWINDTYQVVPDNYFKLPYWVETIMDGSNRRIKVYMRMCLRRVMFPEIDIDTLIFCAYEDVHLFFDNSDGVFNSDYYKRNAMDAFGYTLEELEELYSCTLDWLRSKAPKSGIVLKSGVAYGGGANATIRDIKYEQLDLYYDRSLSVMENLAMLHQIVGFPISERTLYRYCHDRGIALGTLSDDDILANLELSLSVRKNKELLAGMGLKVGERRIIRLLKLARAQQAQQQAMLEQLPIPEYSQLDATANEWPFWGTATYQPFQIGGC